MAEQQVSILAKLIDQVSGPAKGVSSSLRDTERQAGTLSKAVASLRGHLIGLVGAYVGIQTLRRALQEAREASDAAQRLSFAVGENVATLSKINELANELQNTTRFGDDALREIAAQLLNRGVGLDQIETALRATVELSAAMGVDLQTGAAALAATLQGELPRGLGRTIPELRNLSREALQAGQAFDVVLRKFDGTAAALGGNSFGKIDRAYNQIGDSLERVGNVLADLLAEILPRVAQALDGITSYLERPEVRKSLEQLAAFAGWLGEQNGNAMSVTTGFASSLEYVAMGVRDKIAANKIEDPVKRREFELEAQRRWKDFRDTAEGRAQELNKPASPVDPLQQREQVRQNANAMLEKYYAALDAKSELHIKSEHKRQMEHLEFLLEARVINEQEFFDRRAKIENAGLQEVINAELAKEKKVADMLFELSILKRTELTRDEAKELEGINDVIARRKMFEEQLARNLQEQRSGAALAQLDAERFARHELNRELERTRELYETGQIEIFEFSRRNAESQRHYTQAIEESIRALERLKAEATDPDTIAALDRLQGDLRRRQEEEQKRIETVQTIVRDRLQSPTEEFFSSLIRGTATLKQAIGNFLGDIAGQLASFAARMVANRILNSLFGLGDGSEKGTFGGFLNNLGNLFSGIKLFNAGGLVPGAPSTVDTVPIMAAGGEYVIRSGAVQHYGPGVFHALNQAAIPRSLLGGLFADFADTYIPRRGVNHFAAGGLVPEAAPAHAPMPQIVEAVVPPTEQNFERLMRGGLGAFFSILAENRSQVNHALGRA